MTFETEFVPIAPALCCKACLSERVHPVNSCADRSMCSGHGVCILGQCECVGGYRGGDCSVRRLLARSHYPDGVENIACTPVSGSQAFLCVESAACSLQSESSQPFRYSAEQFLHYSLITRSPF